MSRAARLAFGLAVLGGAGYLGATAGGSVLGLAIAVLFAGLGLAYAFGRTG